jgi:hypothetical protein
MCRNHTQHCTYSHPQISEPDTSDHVPLSPVRCSWRDYRLGAGAKHAIETDRAGAVSDVETQCDRREVSRCCSCGM